MLVAGDVLTFCGIRPRDTVMWDIIDEEGLILDQGALLRWNGPRRLQLALRHCPRCTLCDKCCVRTRPHALCSHGGTDHLWRRVPLCEVQEFGPFVEGYFRMAGLSTLDQVMVQTELAAMSNEYDDLIECVD